MEWSDQQSRALTAVKKWYTNKKGNQVFRLFGYAGTGKTTLAKHFAEGIYGDTMYLAYTGKAALEMRKKGCKDASTIHSAIYIPEEDQTTGLIEFTINRNSDIRKSKLIIIDECSFVGDAVGKDLLSFGVKILVLGDPGQLPPIGEEGFFTSGTPDFMLTEIHRQAKDNPIIWLSMLARTSQHILPGKYGDSIVMRRKEATYDFLQEHARSADQVICGMNKTRTNLNKSIRRLKGMQGVDSPDHPVIGDKLICLRNDSKKGFLNGGMWEVITKPPVFVQRPQNHISLQIKSEDDPRLRSTMVKILEDSFTGAESDYDWRIKKKYDDFTFGDAITGHKSQGSQWGSVMIFDESSVFREFSTNWLYTVLTRASNDLVLLLNS